jgi:hypothetical protein
MWARKETRDKPKSEESAKRTLDAEMLDEGTGISPVPEANGIVIGSATSVQDNPEDD